MTTPAAAAKPLARTVARARDCGPGVLRGEVSAAGQAWITDEPFDHGGSEMGPSPHTTLAAALAACTALTLRAYADRKAWPMAHVTVTAEHERQEGETPPDGFHRTVRVEGPLDAEQKARLLAIADRCPVHVTLVTGSRVETRLEG